MLTSIVVAIVRTCTRFATLVVIALPASGGRSELLCGPAFRHQHRHQQADFARPRLAQARQSVRARVRPRKTDSRRRRGADARTRQRREQGAGRKTLRRHHAFRIGAAAGFRRVLRKERAVVPAGGRSRQGRRPARSRRPPDRDHGRRSLDPRPDRRAGDRACRRQARAGQARQYRTALQPDQPDGRGHPEQGNGDVLLARTRQRQAFDRFRPPRLHRVQAEARLQRARTRQGCDRRDPAGRDRSQFCGPIQRAGAADRPGSDRQRGIFDRAGRRDRQRCRNRPHRARDSLDGAAFREDHLCGVREPVHRPFAHDRGRPDDGGIAEPAVDRLCRAVRRPRRRFRHPVQRPLPFRAFQERRSGAGAGERGQTLRGAAVARRDGDRRRLPVFPADRLQGHFRTRQDCRRRHADRVHHQHHGPACHAEAASPARRKRAGRLRVPGAGGRIPRKASRHHRRWHAAPRRGRPAAALFHEVRLQPDQPAQSEGRIDRDLPRPAQGPQHRRQRHQRADHFGSGSEEDRGEAGKAAGSPARDVDRQFCARGSAGEAAVDREGGEGGRARAQSRFGRCRAHRCRRMWRR